MKANNRQKDGVIERINSTQFNSKLAASILHEYYNLYENNKDKLEKTGTKENGSNQAFYDWYVTQQIHSALFVVRGVISIRSLYTYIYIHFYPF